MSESVTNFVLDYVCLVCFLFNTLCNEELILYVDKMLSLHN